MGSERPGHLRMWTLPWEGVSSLRHTPLTHARVYNLYGQDHGGAQNVHVTTQNEVFKSRLNWNKNKQTMWSHIQEGVATIVCKLNRSDYLINWTWEEWHEWYKIKIWLINQFGICRTVLVYIGDEPHPKWETLTWFVWFRVHHLKQVHENKTFDFGLWDWGGRWFSDRLTS